MATRSFVAASVFLLATALTASASADETAREDEPTTAGTPIIATTPTTHVRFDADRGGSLLLWHDGAWERKCTESCSFDLPASLDANVHVVGAYGYGQTIRLPPGGGTIVVRYRDRSTSKAVATTAGALAIVGGVALAFEGLLVNFVANRDPDPDRDRSRPASTKSDGEPEIGIGLALIVLGAVSVAAAVGTRSDGVAVEAKAPPTARRPVWREAQTPAYPEPTSANLFTVRF